MTRRVFFLAHKTARLRCSAHVMEAPEGYMVVVSEPTKKRAQEERYHAMMNDIADQTTYAGKRWGREDTKRILIDEFAAEMRSLGQPLHHDSRLIPSEDGTRIIQLGIQSKEFYVKEASAFIEWLYAYGSMRNVVWTEPETATA